MTSIWIVSPAWRRYAVTRMVLAQRRRLCDALAARGVDAQMLIVADDDNLEIAREHGAVAVEAPNRWLGEKCNAGLRRAGKEGADWVVWIGSDDWVHEDVFDPIFDQPELSERALPPVLIGHRLVTVNLATGKLRRCASPSRFGAIPWIIHRRRLARANFEPLRPNLNRGLDGGLIRGLKKHRVVPQWHYYNPHDFRCVDFKSDTNLNAYDWLARLGIAPEEEAWPGLAEAFDADLVDLARSTHRDLREAACT